VPACIAFDVSAACSGFIYGLAVANGLIATGVAKDGFIDRRGYPVPVYGLDGPRNVRVSLGTGRALFILGASEEPSNLLSLHLSADGSKGSVLEIPGGGSRHPLGNPDVAAGISSPH
jgi:3-oxoacyl-[acyl-carrier-protein] synthase-3